VDAADAAGDTGIGEAALMPETTVLGRYLRTMAGQIAVAQDPDRRALLQEALKLGVAALRGELEEP
jgi:hypothetical protein